MKKFNIEVIINATPEQLAKIDINDVRFCGQAMTAWDFNTYSKHGPCAKVYAFYNEDEYFLIPMKYIQFKNLTEDQAQFIYPDATEATLPIVPGICIDCHVSNLEKTYLLESTKAIYHEVQDYILRVILSRAAYKLMLLECFIEELQAIGLKPVCDNEHVNLEYEFDSIEQKQLRKLFNEYIGFWRSIAIKVDHDREKRIARYHIRYELITGKDLTDEQLMTIVKNIQQKL